MQFALALFRAIAINMRIFIERVMKTMTPDEKKQLKEELSQLIDIKKEIKELNTKINKTKGINNLTDVVEASSKRFPYTKHPIKLVGENVAVASKIDGYRGTLEKRLLDLLDTKARIEIFISKIPNSRLRRIIEIKYMSNEYMSWIKVARKIGGNATADSVRMEHDRFFKNI